MSFFNKPLRTGGAALLLASVAVGAMAASHREAPAITETPKLDGTDFYMFRSYETGRAGYTTLIANYGPIQAPYGGPNYFTMDPDAIYEIHIDNDGDAIEDITFQFDFDNKLAMDGAGIALEVGDETVAIPLRQAGVIKANDRSALNETESYTLTRIDGDRRSGSRAAVKSGDRVNFVKPADYIGDKTFPNYAGYAESFIYDIDIPKCGQQGRVFVGQRAEAFAVNLGPVFDLVNFVPLEGAIDQDRAANDDLVGKANVTSLALEVPTKCLTKGDNPIFGAWTTSSLPQAQIEDPSPTYDADSVFGGAWVQQSRLSAPLVNELVIGLPDKNLFNAAEPMQDAALATYVTNPTLPALLDILFGDAFSGQPDVQANDGNIAPVNLPRTDLVAAFLTGLPGLNQPKGVTASEMLRLNSAIPPTPRDKQSNFGVAGEDLAGFPNGRRPGDDTVDIALRVVMGVLCYPLPLGAELGVAGAVEDQPSDLVNLGYCTPDQAPVGDEPFTDGAPLAATDLQDVFPYLNTPLPGATQ